MLCAHILRRVDIAKRVLCRKGPQLCRVEKCAETAWLRLFEHRIRLIAPNQSQSAVLPVGGRGK